jgi:hypothetical protein
MVKNYGNSKTEVTEGDNIADLLITPVLHPLLFPISAIEMVSKKGLDAQDCLTLIRMTKDEKVLAFFKGLLL